MVLSYLILNNGLKMPVLGLGTSEGHENEVKQAVKDAIDIGYRHIDTAHFYGNEKEIGEAVAEKIKEGTVKREDIFLVSKLWNSHHDKDLVLPALKRTMSDLQIEYVDLYLMHWPFAYKDGWDLQPRDQNGNLIFRERDFIETWKEMEKCVKQGLVKSIGLSNFNRQQIQRILDVAEIHPVTNQIECHPYLTLEDHVAYCKLNKIVITAYRPIAGQSKYADKSPLNDAVIEKISQKYGKTPAQVCLRFQLQRGIAVIPKSTNKDRLKINYDVFDFQLTSEEMTSIMELNKGAAARTCPMSECKEATEYPFKGEYF